MSVTVRAALSPAEVQAVRELFEEYWTAFGFTPCFQNFSSEVEGLPGAYAPPGGRLGLAWVDGQVAGCIALRPKGAGRGEAKRLYVRPQYRGCGVGRALMEWMIGESRDIGYGEIVGDTLPVMANALTMYEAMGFERMSPDPDGPPDAIYIRLDLSTCQLARR